MASGRRYLCNRMHRTQWCLRMAHADMSHASGRRYLRNRMHRTQWCLRMAHADMPPRQEDAISVTACTERSGACGWHMQMLPRVWDHAISVTART